MSQDLATAGPTAQGRQSSKTVYAGDSALQSTRPASPVKPVALTTTAASATQDTDAKASCAPGIPRALTNVPEKL